MNKEEIKKFFPVNVSSKFAICGLPIRVDTYKCCSFQCAYCFSNNRKICEFEKELQIADVEKTDEWLSKVSKGKFKKNDFLATLVNDGITWHCGGMSDPFQPCESKYRITEQLVDVTNKYGVSILFSTKSADIYGGNFRQDLHSFQLSVSNVDNNKLLEPNVPDIQERLNLFRNLKKDGYKVGIRIQPFVPNVSNLEIVKNLM